MQPDCLPRAPPASVTCYRHTKATCSCRSWGGLSGACRGCGVAGHPPVRDEEPGAHWAPTLHWFVSAFHFAPRLLLKLWAVLWHPVHRRTLPAFPPVCLQVLTFLHLHGTFPGWRLPGPSATWQAPGQMVRALESSSLSTTPGDECFGALSKALPLSPLPLHEGGTGFSQGDGAP